MKPSRQYACDMLADLIANYSLHGNRSIKQGDDAILDVAERYFDQVKADVKRHALSTGKVVR